MIEPEQVEPYREPEPFCKLGEKCAEHQPEGIFYMNVIELVEAIDPHKYFITSGEAVAKAKQLEKDIWLLAGKARKLRNLLEKARGAAVYLETEWKDGKLLLRQKNPRKRKPKLSNSKFSRFRPRQK